MTNSKERNIIDHNQDRQIIRETDKHTDLINRVCNPVTTNTVMKNQYKSKVENQCPFSITTLVTYLPTNSLPYLLRSERAQKSQLKSIQNDYSLPSSNRPTCTMKMTMK